MVSRRKCLQGKNSVILLQYVNQKINVATSTTTKFTGKRIKLSKRKVKESVLSHASNILEYEKKFHEENASGEVFNVCINFSKTPKGCCMRKDVIK